MKYTEYNKFILHGAHVLLHCTVDHVFVSPSILFLMLCVEITVQILFYL